MKFGLLPVVVLGCIVGMSSPSRADVRVVPASFSGDLLQLKSLDAKIEIKNGFALTHSIWTFSNSSDADFEAETTVEAPRSAVVSGFAYWFRGQKVVARVVERARAEKLYRDLVHPPTGRPRDPALVEMLSRYFLRAHIAPVAARQDLKIEVVWMQPFTRTAKEQTLDFPLSPTPQMHVRKWKITVVGANPTTNCGALQQGQISGDDQKPLPSVLHLSLPLQDTPAPLISSPGGFFATTGAIPHGASEVFQVSRGGQKLAVGKVKAVSGGRAEFGDVAHTLWSASKLDSLEGNEKNRVAAIHLSIQSGLLCGWTRWLAIPDSERKRLMEARAAIAAAQQLREQGPQLADLIAKNKMATPQFVALKSSFESNAKLAKQDSKAVLERCADNEIEGLYQWMRYPPDRKKPLAGEALEHYQADLLLQMARVSPFTNGWGSDYIAHAQNEANQLRLSNRIERLHENFNKGVDDAALDHEIEALLPIAIPPGGNAGEESAHFQGIVLDPFAGQWVHLPRGDARRSLLEAKIRSLSQLFPDQAQREGLVREAFSDAEYRALEDQNRLLQTQLANEVIANRENSPVAEHLRAQLDSLRAGLEVPLDLAPNASFLSTHVLPVERRLYELAREIQRETFSDSPDQNKIAANQKEIARLQTYYGNAFDPMKSDAEGLARELEPQFVKRWMELTSKPDFDHDAEQKLVARFDDVLTLARANSGSSWVWNEDAKSRLGYAERYRVETRMGAAVDKWFQLQHARVPDPQKSAEALAEVEAFQKGVYYQSPRAPEFLGWSKARLSEEGLEGLREELNKPHPDTELVAFLQQRVLEYAPFDVFYLRQKASRTSTPQEFQRQRMDLIQTRADLQKAIKTRVPEAQIAELKQRENQLRVRVGDPLIAVKAPQSARLVVATLPSGELLPLRFNAETGQWEARFDVPTYRGEGDFQIQIFLVFSDGTRSHLTMHLNVDLSSPSGTAALKFDPQNPHLELECDAATERISAFFASGERVELKRGANGLWGAAIPSGTQMGEAVRFVLTDAAHNRTEISLDLKASEIKTDG